MDRIIKPARDPDTGLWKRGLLLFAVLSAIAGVVLFLALYRPAAATTTATAAPEDLIPLVAAPLAPFPGTISWGALYQLGENLPSPRGWEIRYNAALTLARRASVERPENTRKEKRSGRKRRPASPSSVPVPLDILSEMLDEQRQLVNFRKRLPNGQILVHKDDAQRTVRNALKAFVDWHKHQSATNKFDPRNADVQKVYQAIDRLAQSSTPELRQEAEQARELLGRV